MEFLGMEILWKMALILGIFQGTHGRIGFKKDQSMSLEFPPRLKEKSSGLPLGHLRPLGWQSRPKSRLPEIRQFPTPQEFETKFINPARAVVMRGVMKDVPAMTKWAKDDYLKANYATQDVHVTVKKELLTTGKRKTKFKKFLKEYHYEDWYLSNIVPTAMMKELVLPKTLACGAAYRSLLESEIWMSSGGTSSLLHAHADHDLHCLLSGRKDFMLIEPDYKDNFDWKDKVIQPGAGHSPMDVDMVNMFKYPAVADTPWTWTTLYGGDCVYIPAGILHQVRSLGRSFSSTILWAPSTESDFSDCKGLNLDTVRPLSEAKFMWSYSHGDRHVTDEDLKAETLRRHLTVLMRTEEKLRLAIFREFYEEVMSEIDDYPEGEEVWQLMDTEKTNKISREDLEKMDASVLDKVAAILNKAHDAHRAAEERKKDEL